MPSTAESYSFAFCPYRRDLSRPLLTAGGKWSVREGLVVRLQDEAGNTGYGEIAPLPAFGTENTEEALRFCASIPSRVGADEFDQLSAEAPTATAYGMWAAREDLMCPGEEPLKSATSALLSINDEALSRVIEYRRKGYRVFKIKLGMADPSSEWNFLQGVLDGLVSGEQLRLDPNRGWDQPTWEFWTGKLSPHAGSIEYIEEPFCREIHSPEDLLQVARETPIPLALDESLYGEDFSRWLDLGWPGFWVVKASLLGTPDWIAGLMSKAGRVVVSSALETGIGMGMLIRLASRFPDTVHGLGTGDLFNDSLGATSHGPLVISPSPEEKERIWNALKSS